MPTYVKIMGERNSGTNFTVRTLQENFDIESDPEGLGLTRLHRFILTRWILPPTASRMLEDYFWHRLHIKSLPTLGGWKHAPVTPAIIAQFAALPDRQIICVVRHPLAWARSMQRNPFHAVDKIPEAFSDFLTMQWTPRPRDGLGKAPLPSPLVLWREKVRNYLATAEEYDNIHVVKYEDLLLDPAPVMARLSEYLGPPKGEFKHPEGRMRAFVEIEETAAAYRKKVRETSLSTLDDAQRALFDTHIGADLMRKLSYS